MEKKLESTYYEDNVSLYQFRTENVKKIEEIIERITEKFKNAKLENVTAIGYPANLEDVKAKVTFNLEGFSGTFVFQHRVDGYPVGMTLSLEKDNLFVEIEHTILFPTDQKKPRRKEDGSLVVYAKEGIAYRVGFKNPPVVFAVFAPKSDIVKEKLEEIWKIIQNSE